MTAKISVILPAHNEAASLENLLPAIRAAVADAEIIVVNDSSTDDTVKICERHAVKVVSRPYRMGNGAAIKAGAREADGDILVFMDADGQHRPEDIPRLLGALAEGYDMVVGTRSDAAQASLPRLFANRLYNRLASWITAHPIADLTSGFRAVDAVKFREFLHLLPNGFSYPTTITMAFFRSGYSVRYLPVEVLPRIGSSHIRPLHDGMRFLLIIFKIGTLYTPLKFFVPISALIFLTGLAYYAYTFLAYRTFTNMSALLFTTSIIVFLIGIVSEQLTMLFYRDRS